MKTAAVDVVIVGAGGYGREVLQYCQDLQGGAWPYRVVGFLDDRPDGLGERGISVPVLGGFGDLPSVDASGFVIAVGDPALRCLLADAVEAAGRSLVSVVHPLAYVASSAQIGPGAVLCPYALVAAHAVVGANVSVNVYGSIGHDARIGDHCVISPYSAVLGTVTIGKESLLGTHCTIMPGVTLGRRVKVSAGATVTRDAASGSLLVGNPAKGRVMFSVD